MKKTLIGAAVFALGLTGALAFTAPASAEVTTDCKTVEFNLTDRSDTGTGGHVWAKNTMSRTLKVCATDEKEGIEPGVTWWYAATVTDNGTFVTQDGKTPRGEAGLSAGIEGAVTGNFKAHFLAKRAFGDWTPEALENNTSTSAWVKTVMPSADGSLIEGYRWDYKTACETYTDNNDDYIGDITSKCVTAEKPDYTAPTCAAPGVVKLKTTEGVKYTATRNVENDVTVFAKVTAEATTGYKLTTAKNPEWIFPVAQLTGKQCETSPSPSPSSSTPPADVELTPTAPKIGKVTCDQFELLTDERDGLNWNVADTKVNGDTVTVNVVVTADKGYTIKGQTEWDLSFKIPTNCTATPAPTEVPTSPAAGGQLPVTGPSGGANVPLISGLAGSALLAFGIALFAWAKRRRDNDAVEFTA